jgi:hypothetical protein
MRREFTALSPAFDSFLCAHVEDAQPEQGMSTSVMSALSRAGLDPWREAARLAALPRHAAVRSLASVLGRLPNVADGSEAAAERLVALLPDPARVAEAVREEAPSGVVQGAASRWVIVALIVAAMIAMHFYS